MRRLVNLFVSDFLRRIDRTIPDENSYSGCGLLRGKVIYTATNNIIENWFVRLKLFHRLNWLFFCRSSQLDRLSVSLGMHSQGDGNTLSNDAQQTRPITMMRQK